MGTADIKSNSSTETTLIAQLKAVSSASNAGRIVALYIAGMSERKVWAHIKQKTFSGARAIEHIAAPDTAAARAAWSRGKDVCRAAHLPTCRSSWTDRPNEELFDMSNRIGQINEQMKDIKTDPTSHLPTKADIDLADSQLRKTPGEVIGTEAILDQAEVNFNKAGKPLKENWREITRRNIEIWFGKK